MTGNVSTIPWTESASRLEKNAMTARKMQCAEHVKTVQKPGSARKNSKVKTRADVKTSALVFYNKKLKLNK